MVEFIVIYPLKKKYGSPLLLLLLVYFLTNLFCIGAWDYIYFGLNPLLIILKGKKK